uniref:hypothetical protein n=1 Tax=Burkholderia gladioli TaxID=28095 RepID=UPI00359C7CF5
MAEIAYLEDGVLHAGGRAGLKRDELERFAGKLRGTDHVVLETAGNTAAIVNVLRPHVARVAIANPLLVRLIARARVKTDRAKKIGRKRRPVQPMPACLHGNGVISQPAKPASGRSPEIERHQSACREYKQEKRGHLSASRKLASRLCRKLRAWRNDDGR